jgi:hypothetical protein
LAQKLPPGIFSSQLENRNLINTFTAARILFPNQLISKANLRVVQRLCQGNRLDCWKIGRKYFIDRESLDRFIDEARYRSSWGALD